MGAAVCIAETVALSRNLRCVIPVRNRIDPNDESQEARRGRARWQEDPHHRRVDRRVVGVRDRQARTGGGCRDHPHRRRPGSAAHAAHRSQAPDRTVGLRVRRHQPCPRAALRDAIAAEFGTLDGALHAIGFAPEAAARRHHGRHLGRRQGRGRDLGPQPQDPRRSRSAADDERRLDRRAGFRRHGRLAGVQLDGIRQSRTGIGQPLLGPRTGPQGIRVNLVAAGPIKTMAAKSIPGFTQFEDVWDDRAPLGWDVEDSSAVARSTVAAAVGLVPGHHRLDDPCRRRLTPWESEPGSGAAVRRRP